jgi:hypothetical protein
LKKDEEHKATNPEPGTVNPEPVNAYKIFKISRGEK